MTDSADSPWRSSVHAFVGSMNDHESMTSPRGQSLRDAINKRIFSLHEARGLQIQKVADAKRLYEEAVSALEAINTKAEQLQLTATMAESPRVVDAVRLLRTAFDLFDTSLKEPDGFKDDYGPMASWMDMDDYADFDPVSEALDKVLDQVEQEGHFATSDEAAIALTAVTAYYLQRAPKDNKTEEATQYYQEGKEQLVATWEGVVADGGRIHKIVSGSRTWCDVIQSLNDMDPQKSLTQVLEALSE